MGIFHLFHLFAEVETSHFVDFHPEMEVTLDWEIFISTLFHSPHIFFDGPWVWCMNFYKIVLVLDNYVNGFDLCFTFSITFVFCILVHSVGKII
jgi:hypothetical protein